MEPEFASRRRARPEKIWDCTKNSRKLEQTASGPKLAQTMEVFRNRQNELCRWNVNEAEKISNVLTITETKE
jgi:hypothetical protein